MQAPEHDQAQQISHSSIEIETNKPGQKVEGRLSKQEKRGGAVQGKARIAHHYLGGKIHEGSHQAVYNARTSNRNKKDENVENNSYARSSLGVVGYQESTRRSKENGEIELSSKVREVREDVR